MVLFLCFSTQSKYLVKHWSKSGNKDEQDMATFLFLFLLPSSDFKYTYYK